MTRRLPPRSIAAVGLAALALSGCSFIGASEQAPEQPSATRSAAAPAPDQVGGQVTDEAGRPLFGARLELDGAGAVSDGDGRFVIARPAGDSLLTVSTSSGYGFTPVDAQGDDELHVTVHPAPSGALTLRFGGEVRTGRSLLPRSAGTAAYAEALAGVEPLLADADASAVTLASPLVEDPWTQDVDASSGLLADALAQSGVSVANLATDRIADAGEAAVQGTRETLTSAGIVPFGAGRDLDAAWRPGVISLGQRSVAYVGCQIGDADAGWAATADRPGAAPCTPARMRRAIDRAERGTDAVVVFIRDDRPYATSVSPTFSSRVKLAVRSGATVIVGGGTHVAGEVWDFGNATATQSPGDLLTDDLSWQARDGFLLRTDVSGNEAVSVTAEPLTRTDGRPSIVKGDLAEEISRIAASDINDGPLVLADDMAVVSAGTWTIDQATVPAPVDDDGSPLELADGWWLPPAGQRGVMTGYDLVPTGTFEDVDSDPRTDGAIGWLLSPGTQLLRADEADEADEADGSRRAGAPAVCEGQLALRLDAGDGDEATAFTSGRVPLPTSAGISIGALVSDVGDDPIEGRLSLEWFDGDTRVGEDFVALEEFTAPCQVARMDAVAPAGTDAVRPVVRISSGAAVVDDLHVVTWEPGRNGGRRWSRLRVFEPVQVTLVVDVPRDAEPPAGPFRDTRSGSEQPDG